MHPYRVETCAVAAELLLIDGRRLPGRLFVAPASPGREGAQTPVERLAEPGRVVPFQGDDGRLLLVGRAGVAAIRVAPTHAEDADLLVRVPARVSLLGGHELAGELVGDAGTGTRASDLLNAAGEWIRLEDGDAVSWLAKPHLLTVEPREG